MLNPSILAIAFVFVAASADAQQPVAENPASARITADTGTVEEGRQAGKAAAGEREVQGRAFWGFIGGLPIGFFGPLLTQGDPGGPIGIGTGLAIIGAAGSIGSTRPPPTHSNGERGESYRRAYSESYRKTVVQRRWKVATLGGLAGVVTGFGLLISLLSSLDT